MRADPDASPGPAAAVVATPAAAWARLAAVRPAAYARTRNHLAGAVTGLSPYLTHGLLGTREVRDALQARHGIGDDHKLVFELAWREYFRHVWRHEGAGIFESLHAGPLPDAAYARALPDDVRHGCTGVPAIDQAVRKLYTTGTLHNHARMWLASYLVHIRKVHWRAGADWMVGHLLDGDLASNHLSWQWVAGTASAKPYLFNADNVARYAPAAWHSAGTTIDRPYAELDRIAREARAYPEPGARRTAIDEPARFGVLADATGRVGLSVDGPARLGAPVDGTARIGAPVDPPAGARARFGCADATAVRGRDVWLVHPWSLADPPPHAAGSLIVALLDADFHTRWPWSARRWDFVLARLAGLGTLHWCDGTGALLDALAAARRVRGVADPHLDPRLVALGLDPAPRLFDDPPRRCRSFSAFWSAVRPRA